MDCLVKTVRSEGYFGMYRGKITHNFIFKASVGQYTDMVSLTSDYYSDY